MATLDTLISAFNRWHQGDEQAGAQLDQWLLLLAVDYASRHPLRCPSNPFAHQPSQVKALLDSSYRHWLRLYLGLGDHAQLMSQLEDAQVATGFIARRPSSPLRPAHSQNDGGIRREPLPSDIDIDELRHWHRQTLTDNQCYLDQNPNTRRTVDEQACRIWLRNLDCEGRRRGYWLNRDRVPKPLFQLMNHPLLLDYAQQFCGSPVVCESLLCEELQPLELVADQRAWHFDKLADQVKIFIALDPVDENNGALRWLNGTLPEQLAKNSQPLGYLHHSYIYAGMHTANVNFVSPGDPVLVDRQEQCGVQASDQILLLDTRIIHSGSPCRQNQRRHTMTLTYKVHSWRNEALLSLPSLYA